MKTLLFGLMTAVLTCLVAAILLVIWEEYDLLDFRSMLGIGFLGFLIGIAGDYKLQSERKKK
ncbi:MAG: hypothetical protein IJH37_09230 [Clostridia bacterium]|nr:hypothetical protein [Clostridia bacterium]